MKTIIETILYFTIVIMLSILVKIIFGIFGDANSWGCGYVSGCVVCLFNFIYVIYKNEN